jgi:hypothetical protein
MPILTKEIENNIRINAREGFADDLVDLSKGTYKSAIDNDNSMHVGSVSDDDLKRGCEQTSSILKNARDLGINGIDWLKWHIVISPVRQQPVIFIEIKFSILMKYKELCSTYSIRNVDEADIVMFDQVNANVMHEVSDEQLGNITGTYVQCIFEYKESKLPLLIQFDKHERISAESAWEYQVIGMGEKIDIIAIALNLRLLKHAGDRMNVLNGKSLFEVIQGYYNGLFHYYEEAQQDANRFTKQTRGVHIGDPETEAILRKRLRNIDTTNNDYSDQTVVNFPEPDHGFDDAFNWL